MSNSSRTLLLITLVASVLATTLTIPCAAQSLAWKFAKGDSFVINIQQDTTVKTVVDRRVVDQNNQMTMEIDWVVDRVDSDAAVVRQTITRIVAELTMPGADGPRTVNYDSANEKHKGDARRMASSFSCIINQPIHVTITSRGEITGVEVPEETLESLRQMPGSIQGRRMFEEDSIRELFVQAGMQLPEPDAGNSWETKREFRIGTPQKFNLTTKYSIADADKNPLKIQFTGTLALIEDTGQRPPELEFENIELADQESSGTISFDTESGNCTSSNSTTMLKTRTRYRDMEVMSTVDSSVKMTVERK
ncbi:MAG: DUF6263 family protein [Pirellulaceae bacterium]